MIFKEDLGLNLDQTYPKILFVALFSIFLCFHELFSLVDDDNFSHLQNSLKDFYS